jgi:hypothetical protein
VLDFHGTPDHERDERSIIGGKRQPPTEIAHAVAVTELGPALTRLAELRRRNVQSVPALQRGDVRASIARLRTNVLRQGGRRTLI